MRGLRKDNGLVASLGVELVRMLGGLAKAERERDWK